MNKRLITALAALAFGGLIIFTVGITVSTVNTKDKNQNLAVPTAECSTAVPQVSTPAKEAPAGMQSLALKRKIVRAKNAQRAKDEHITVPQAKSQKAKQLLDKVLAGRKMSSLEAENYNRTPVEIQELAYEQAHQREEYYRGLMEKDPSGKTEQGAKKRRAVCALSGLCHEHCHRGASCTDELRPSPAGGGGDYPLEQRP